MNKIEAIEWQRERAERELLAARSVVADLEEAIRRLDGAKDHALSDAPVKSGGPTFCTGCGADVSTERAFSMHYVIPEPRFYNLGNCPNRVRSE